MIGWTVLTMFAALLVLVRVAHFVNCITVHSVPHHVALTMVALGTGAFVYMIAPLYGEPFTWRDALFAAAVATYIWVERRAPIGGSARA